MNVKLYVYVICACCTCVCVLYIDMCQEMDREILGNIVDGNAALAAIAGKSQTLRSSLDLFKVVKECVNEIAAATKHIGVATLESRPTPFVPDKQYVYEVNVLINSHEKILGAIDKFRKDVYLLHFAPGHGEHLYKEVYSQVGIEKLGLKVNDEKFQASVVAAGKIVVAAQKHTQKKKEEEPRSVVRILLVLFMTSARDGAEVVTVALGVIRVTTVMVSNRVVVIISHGIMIIIIMVCVAEGTLRVVSQIRTGSTIRLISIILNRISSHRIRRDSFTRILTNSHRWATVVTPMVSKNEHQLVPTNLCVI